MTAAVYWIPADTTSLLAPSKSQDRNNNRGDGLLRYGDGQFNLAGVLTLGRASKARSYPRPLHDRTERQYQTRKTLKSLGKRVSYKLTTAEDGCTWLNCAKRRATLSTKIIDIN
ncbi:hypothetical protein DPMN_091167 [Dreissena polymorpha]|uniref:Uncharacterized protein n=1 Tax=Dreissena polymorpha TaxID=45954 RepID=A0A9D4L145_DREPO|nr:hypothetical protein DPMN_091167 [Dreissena polymorpha]